MTFRSFFASQIIVSMKVPRPTRLVEKSEAAMISSNQAQLAELITQMTTQEDALARGLQVVSGRLTKLIWLSGSALLIASVAVVLVFVLRS